MTAILMTGHLNIIEYVPLKMSWHLHYTKWQAKWTKSANTDSDCNVHDGFQG